MTAGLEKQTRRWTYEDYYHLEDGQRYEIIEGELIRMAPAPDIFHQNWALELVLRLREHVKQNKLGQVFIAPVDVGLSANDVVQPDVVFVSAARAGIIERRGIMGVPDLVVEVLSPATARDDRSRKRDLYARAGISEYWIADPANRTLEVLTLKSGTCELSCYADERTPAQSTLLAGLEIDLATIG